MNLPENMTLQATVESDGAKKASRIDRGTWSDGFAWVARILILMALVAAPWFVGSVHLQPQFWISTALLVALAFWWFETAMNKRSAQVLPYLGLLVFLGLLLGLFQTIPLSGGLADTILGRQAELYADFAQSVTTDTDTARQASYRVSLSTDGTWHQIRLLVIALSAMLLCCRYFRTPRDLTIFFAVMTANGVAISIFGLIQKLSWNGKLFWFIDLQTGGFPFGPFVNRNNAGGYLLICLACAIGLLYLAMSNRKRRGPIPIISKEIPVWRQFSQQLLYFISELDAIKVATLLAVVFLSFGIVATISRGAILALLIATTFTILSYGVAKKPKSLSVIVLPLGLAVVLLTVWLGFNEQIVDRFDKVNTTSEFQEWDNRVQTWKDTWPSVAEMGKLGSGLGTYETVSRLYRTDKETRVFKYAENQYFQALIEAGWPGLIIYLLACGLAFYYSYFLLRIGVSPATVSAGLAGVFLVWAQAVASFFDYGLYIPANTLAMSSLMGVIAYFAQSMAYRLKQKSWLRLQCPNTLVQIIIVAVFAGCTMVSLDLSRKSRVENLRSRIVLTYDHPDHQQTDEKIRDLNKLVVSAQSRKGINELGRLWIHRGRLELFDVYKSRVKIRSTDLEQMDRLWDQTSLVRIQEQSELLRQQSRLSQKEFLSEDALQVNLPMAKRWLDASLKLSPFQPEVQVVLGEITSILSGIDKASVYLERGIRLAPANATLLRQVAVLYVQAGEMKQAAPHIRKYLELEPGEFDLIMSLTVQRMVEGGEEPDLDLIASSMLPDDPRLIYLFAKNYAIPGSVTQKTALERAQDLLEDVSLSNFYVRPLMGRISTAMGDLEAGIEHFRAALVNNPNDIEVRYELVKALVDRKMYEEALEHARDLKSSNDKNRAYQRLYDGIKSEIERQKKLNLK